MGDFLTRKPAPLSQLAPQDVACTKIHTCKRGESDSVAGGIFERDSVKGSKVIPRDAQVPHCSLDLILILLDSLTLSPSLSLTHTHTDGGSKPSRAGQHWGDKGWRLFGTAEGC